MENSIQELLKTSKKYKETAAKFLQEKNLIEDLGNFGRVELGGSYSYDLMMNGDIDLYVVRNDPFSAEEMAEIFKFFYLKRKFKSYFILGDWYDRRKGNEWPHGHYIGLKDDISGDKWVVDAWFVSEEEFKAREKKEIVKNVILTEEQKQLILLFKKYRNENKLRVPGQTIYQLVISGECKNLEDFKARLTSSEIK
ncbi:MAG: hypothetical protein WCX77_01725 [Candidatus Paceibacterota bacterium]|jgi:hypothetical protein